MVLIFKRNKCAFLFCLTFTLAALFYEVMITNRFWRIDIIFWGQRLSDGCSGLLGNHTHPKPVLILGIVLQAHHQYCSSSISANTRMFSTPFLLLLFALVLVSCTAFAVADDDCEYSGSGDCDDECWQGVIQWTNIYPYYMHHIILSLLCGKNI